MNLASSPDEAIDLAYEKWSGGAFALMRAQRVVKKWYSRLLDKIIEQVLRDY
ncbi:hypothetical protein NG800_002340 [Epilithonimonas ginsengisoli]|uniref:Uncharacterized protein n=1 Tax=Epilithonimonas ginsengisoli TaxID=1245592 RepID=A0ABU4JDI5_9FLAO|nr:MULTISPECIES: hypothetical protein [Chryseobacterium group]MBV6878706.1 hypothetical protein [Epilithonimonas sp. FP105]MDW8547732.1 hypothetical protein [Epilithonimonas ginsengisoli]